MPDFNPALPLPIKWNISDDRFDPEKQVLSLTIPVDSVTHLIDHLQNLVNSKAKADPPISTEARNSINEKLKMVNELYPDKMKGLIEAYTKEFNVKKITPITLARQGEFLSHAISKIDDTL